ncbi:hypothetical protein [uncultured Ruegeria sp.]|uniref:hypothetical protein n=1 Tax=uncultured Ruegeria sp. TaxID=259304 RepID=UPI002627F81D|nr:hypothetical protein [uncultured Ruegeria sp.]
MQNIDNQQRAALSQFRSRVKSNHNPLLDPIESRLISRICKQIFFTGFGEMSNPNPYVANFRALLALTNSSVGKFSEEIGRHQSSVQNVLLGVRRSRFIEEEISKRLGVSRELAFPVGSAKTIQFEQGGTVMT